MEIQATKTFDKTWSAYINENHRQIVSMGGSRSSKSYSILQLLLIEMVRTPNTKVTVWRDTKVNCRATVMEDFQDIILFDKRIYDNIKQNKQTGTFTYTKNNSKIVFEGADSVGKVLGSKQTISFFNEITEFSEDVYLQIAQRTSHKIFVDYNPSKSFFINKYKNDPKTIFIHSTYKDNYFCPKPIVEHIESYEPWEKNSYEIENGVAIYEGNPITNKNQPPPNVENIERNTANEFMWMVYGLGLEAEKPNRIYKNWYEITDEQFDKINLTSYFGLDFGASNPTACVEVKYDEMKGAFYVRERLYTPLQDIGESLPTVIGLKVPQIAKGKSLVVCDSAKKMYIDLMTEDGYLAIGAEKGSGSVEAGISIVQSLTIYFVPTENLITEYKLYSWHLDRYNKSTDKPVEKDDHLLDALRYVISYLVEYLNIKL